jgi:hypothetical protein
MTPPTFTLEGLPAGVKDVDKGTCDGQVARAIAMMRREHAIQPRRRKKGPVKKPPDRPLPLPDGGGADAPDVKRG